MPAPLPRKWVTHIKHSLQVINTDITNHIGFADCTTINDHGSLAQ
jgi:hypothetical protein